MSAIKERLTISIDSSVKHSLDEIVPQNQRSAFAESALREAILKHKRREALAALDQIQPAPNPTKVLSENILRTLRETQGNDLLQHNPVKS